MYRQIDRTDTVCAGFRSTTDPMLDPYGVLIDRVQQLDLELQTVSIELESTVEQMRRVWRQNTLILESLPMGAILIDQSGHIRIMNQKAKELLRLGTQAYERKQIHQMWDDLGFPSVPSMKWEHGGRTLQCWEGQMSDEPGNLPCETIRFIQEVPAESPPSHCGQLAALGEIAGHIAHEIRNPLGSIELFATLLARPHDQEERQSLSAHLSTSVRALDQVLSNVLVLANPQRVQVSETLVRSLLNEVEVLAFRQLRASRITLKRVIDEDAELIEADATRLRQALLNLLLNAIHASPEGGTIEIDCRRSIGVDRSCTLGKEEEFIVLRVRDFGRGIDMQDMADVFKPFFSKRDGGTGLGLPIVRQVAEAHGGSVDILSEVGLGTTVSVSIPLKRRPR